MLRDLSSSGAGRKPGIAVALRQSPGPNYLVVVESPNTDFAAGTLVELSLPDRLCLGEILSREGNLVIIRPEHTLQREALDDIRKNWKQVAPLAC